MHLFSQHFLTWIVWLWCWVPFYSKESGNNQISEDFLGSSAVKNLPAMQETWVQPLGQEYPLEKEMATHSSHLVWKILWTKEAGGLPFLGSQRVGHNLGTKQETIKCPSGLERCHHRTLLPTPLDTGSSENTSHRQYKSLVTCEKKAKQVSLGLWHIYSYLLYISTYWNF